MKPVNSGSAEQQYGSKPTALLKSCMKSHSAWDVINDDEEDSDDDSSDEDSDNDFDP